MSDKQFDLEGNEVKPWVNTAQAATEWNPDSIDDLTEGTLYTVKPAAYVKHLQWKDDDGTEKSADKHYAWLAVDGMTLPIRINKFSIGELSKAWGPDLKGWDGKKAVVIVDRSKKYPFVVVKPKPDSKGAARKGRGKKA